MRTSNTLVAAMAIGIAAGMGAVALLPTLALADPTAAAPPSPALPTFSSSSSSSAPPPMGVWTGTGQVGYVASQGNSPAKSANVVLDTSYLENAWKDQFHFDFLYGQSGTVTSADRWDALWQTNYNFTSTLFVFGSAVYVRDLFDGFQYQGSTTAGLGYNLIKTSATTLSVQVGAGYLWQRPEEVNKDSLGIVTSRVPLPTQNTTVGTVGLTYSQKLTASTTLSDSFLFNGGSGNSMITNNLALTVKMSTKLALSLGYNIVDNTQPPPASPPLKSLDSFETVNLVYSF
jgi:putative salt-induced outer membrane protein